MQSFELAVLKSGFDVTEAVGVGQVFAGFGDIDSLLAQPKDVGFVVEEAFLILDFYLLLFLSYWLDYL